MTGAAVFDLQGESARCERLMLSGRDLVVRALSARQNALSLCGADATLAALVDDLNARAGRLPALCHAAQRAIDARRPFTAELDAIEAAHVEIAALVRDLEQRLSLFGRPCVGGVQ